MDQSLQHGKLHHPNWNYIINIARPYPHFAINFVWPNKDKMINHSINMGWPYAQKIACEDLGNRGKIIALNAVGGLAVNHEEAL